MKMLSNVLRLLNRPSRNSDDKHNVTITDHKFECSVQWKKDGTWKHRLLSVRRGSTGLLRLHVFPVSRRRGVLPPTSFDLNDIMECCLATEKRHQLSVITTSTVISLRFESNSMREFFKRWLDTNTEHITGSSRCSSYDCTMEYAPSFARYAPEERPQVRMLIKKNRIIILEKNVVIAFVNMRNITKAAILNNIFWFTTAKAADIRHSDDFFSLRSDQINEINERLNGCINKYQLTFPFAVLSGCSPGIRSSSYPSTLCEADDYYCINNASL